MNTWLLFNRYGYTKPKEKSTEQEKMHNLRG